MGPLHWVLMALEGIGLMAVNPALGGGGAKRERIAQALAMLRTILSGGEAMFGELKTFAQEIKALADAGQEPSRGQWEAMMARDQAARIALAEAKARLLGQPPPAQPERPTESLPANELVVQ